jgi:replicative DNA helicase
VSTAEDILNDSGVRYDEGFADEPPTPLSPAAKLPPFPAAVLPGWLGDHVVALARATQTPLDLGGTLALAMLATCAGGRVVVEVRRGWREPTNLYVAPALPPGNRKSAVHEATTRPLRDVEATLAEEARAVIAESAMQKDIATKAAEKARNAASGAQGDQRDRLTAEAVAAAQLVEAITVPVLPRLLADDVTPEAAVSLLADHGGRISIVSAEGGIFDILAGRYSASGMPNLDWALKGHAGDPLRVDRKGRSPEYIPHPALTMLLTVQLAVLDAIGRNGSFRGRGLLARFLYSLPESTVGRRDVDAEPISDELSERYQRSVRALALTLAEWTDPAVLTLTPEAAAILLDYERRIEPRLGPDGDLGYADLVTEWASKVVGAAARIAGLLHLAGNLDRGWSQPIDADSITAAVRLAEYYTAHAVAAFDRMAADPMAADASYLLTVIRRLGAETVSQRDLFTSASRARFRKVGDLAGPLRLLDEHGYLLRLPTAERTGPGRPPSPSWQVHPACWDVP